jgi:CTP:molybdopterin cytidylyltransferase MocA
MGSMILRPWVVLLAAGASRRFGRPKQLARVGGESLLRRMARVALASDPAGCVVVLGARAELLRRELRGLPLTVVVNPCWRSGMSGSLAAGLRALPGGARAALVLLADQAAVGPADLALLVGAWRANPRRPAAVRTESGLSPPAVLPRRLFPLLKRLRGDRGARDLLRDPACRTVGIPLPAAAIDVDRPADLARLAGARPEYGRGTAPMRRW